MNRLFFTSFLFFGATSCIWAHDYQFTAQGLTAYLQNQEVQITYYAPNIVRIHKKPLASQVEELPSFAVIALPEKVKVQGQDKAGQFVLKSGALTVKVNEETGAISFYDKRDTLLLSELPVNETFRPIDDAGRASYRVTQSFQLRPDEAIYGLGQTQSGKMSQRGIEKKMIQNNTEDFSPVIQSVRGYGLFWDNYSPTWFRDNAEGTTFESEVGDCMDYYFIWGGSMDGTVAGLRKLTGEVPMFPLWTYGFFQSKERYKSQDETVGVVRRHRELGVPLDGIIQDWQYWGSNYLWNAMEFLNDEFPDPQRMIDEVHAMHAHEVISIWASFGPMTKQYRELKAAGEDLLWGIKTWPQSGSTLWPPKEKDYPSGVMVYNPYSSVARDIYWKYLNQGIFRLGMDGWWMDSTEPDHLYWPDSDLNLQTGLGSWRRVRNAFPLQSVGGVYDRQRAEIKALKEKIANNEELGKNDIANANKRIFILTRSGFIGQQRYGSNVWTGDVGSSWESFRAQIPAGLNFNLTGMPHWNTDLGGFFCAKYNGPGYKAAQNPLYQELYVRWLQFGVFCPMMRSHGADAPREIWQFGEPGSVVYEAIAKSIRQRYALIPYIYSTSWQVTNRQGSFMRALAMDFADDQEVWDMNNEYMFGDAFLVCPVTHAQYTPEVEGHIGEMDGWNRTADDKAKRQVADFTEARSMQVYLPKGTQWYDWYSGQQYEGGQHIDYATRFDEIPLMVRAGSIVPMQTESVQYTTEKAWDDLTIRVYPGADGSFILYEDEFDNYNYEDGNYTEIPLSWNDKSRTLTIGRRASAYEGMIQSRDFNILLPDGTQKSVHYDGKSVKVKL